MLLLRPKFAWPLELQILQMLLANKYAISVLWQRGYQELKLKIKISRLLLQSIKLLFVHSGLLEPLDSWLAVMRTCLPFVKASAKNLSLIKLNFLKIHVQLLSVLS